MERRHLRCFPAVAEELDVVLFARSCPLRANTY